MQTYHIALNMGLLSLAAGTALVLWAQGAKACKKTAKVVGAVIIIIAALSTLCSTYFASKECHEFSDRCKMHNKMGGGDDMGDFMKSHMQYMMPGQNKDAAPDSAKPTPQK